MSIVEKRVAAGLDAVDPTRTVELPLVDALFTYRLLGELIAFFHQPEQWRSIADVEAFLGTSKEGALHLIWEAYYERLRDIWPPDVSAGLESGEL